ncbi:hypothetical protein [Nocardia sp. CY41]|uniref:hypothetical protein n=1 Tax=Nocardia sp. CY41 TaxID=2608686 RepID=UPI00135AE2E3|nr:hypothetical protein [Nocardia sp. CY41]
MEESAIMQRRWLTVPIALLSAGLAACSVDDTSSPTTTTPSTAAATVAAVPAYEFSEDGKKLTALVRTDDTDQLRLVYREISGRVLASYPAGGYFLNLDCAFGNDPSKAANRLATAKIAVGPLGAAQTGLEPGKASIDFNTGRMCREGAAPETFNADRSLDRDYAVELCRGRVEEKYVADQRPVKMMNIDVTEASGRWTVTGTAQGKSKPGGGEMAKVSFQCVSTNDGLLKTDLVKFDVVR